LRKGPGGSVDAAGSAHLPSAQPTLSKSRVLRAFSSLAVAASICAVPLAADARRPTDPVTLTSRPVRLLRSWQETVKVGDQEYPRQVRVVFDYARGEAREESRDARGVLRSVRRFREGLPAPSAAEIAEAFAVTRGDASLAPLFGRFSVVLDGGFLLEEDAGMPCGPGSRCLHVFLLSSDRAGTIRRVVVDLVKREIVYPVYVPAAGEGHGR
jgi:hypothetical protein